MKPVAGGGQAIIAIDASVLINFLRIDRTDLLAGHSRDFLATDCAASEIADRYPDQQQRFANALKTGTIAEARVAAQEELRIFASLLHAGRLWCWRMPRHRYRRTSWLHSCNR